MQVDLDGQVALLAHGDSEVARAVAAALARNGARVVDVGAADITPHDMLVVCAQGDATDAARTIERAIPQMRENGRVVTIVSAAGLVPLRGDSARAVAQSGLVTLTRALALELGHGVRVNAVAVGALEGGGDARMLSHVPLGRAGTAAEVADAVLFLVDPQNSYTTGHVLAVDGGWTAGYGRDF